MLFLKHVLEDLHIEVGVLGYYFESYAKDFGVVLVLTRVVTMHEVFLILHHLFE